MKTLKQILFCTLLLLPHGRHVQGMEQHDISLDELIAAAIPTVAEHFNHKELFVFDGADGANQCHINALMVVELARQNQPFDQLLPEQQRFLALNFLRSMPLRHLDNESIKHLHDQLGIPPQTKKHRDFLSGALSAALLAAKQTFFDRQLSRFVGQPWNHLAFVEHRPLVRQDIMILPKLVGIWCCMEFLKEESAHGRPIWTVVTCTCPDKSVHTWLITPDQQTLCSLSDVALAPDTLVIVIQANCSRETDVPALDPERLQLANAVSWMHAKQPKAVLPEVLHHIGDDMGTFACEQHIGPSTKEPIFDIQHMLPDTLEHAVQSTEDRS